MKGRKGVKTTLNVALITLAWAGNRPFVHVPKAALQHQSRLS